MELKKSVERGFNNVEEVPPENWYTFTLQWSGHMGSAGLMADFCSLKCFKSFIENLWKNSNIP